MTTLYCISTYVGPLCIALFTSPVPIWTYCNSGICLTVLCIAPQYLCVTTLYCISTYVGPLYCTSSVPMWDHFALHQYLCGTTLYCTVYLISTYVGPLCIVSVPMCMTTLYCTVYLTSTYVGPLCIATLCIYLISRPICMCDHFVLHCDCLPHQYLCGTTLYCISTYVGPLCIVLFTSSVPMWDHFALHQYLCGTTLYCTVYLTSTPVPMWDHFGPPVSMWDCIVSVHMWDHFVLHCLPHQYLFGTTLYCNSRYMPHQ